MSDLIVSRIKLAELFRTYVECTSANFHRDDSNYSRVNIQMYEVFAFVSLYLQTLQLFYNRWVV